MVPKITTLQKAKAVNIDKRARAKKKKGMTKIKTAVRITKVAKKLIAKSKKANSKLTIQFSRKSFPALLRADRKLAFCKTIKAMAYLIIKEKATAKGINKTNNKM